MPWPQGIVDRVAEDWMENPGWLAALDLGAIEVAHLALVKMWLTAALDEGVTRGWTGSEERAHRLGNRKGQEE
jgi:hypothetical protein